MTATGQDKFCLRMLPAPGIKEILTVPKSLLHHSNENIVEMVWVC